MNRLRVASAAGLASGIASASVGVNLFYTPMDAQLVAVALLLLWSSTGNTFSDWVGMHSSPR